MTTIPPVPFFWDGESMVTRHPILADKHYTIGENYVLVEHQERSLASHGHYFACLREAWLNLSDADMERFPTQEHLRKYALIKAGYHDQRSIVCASKAEANRMAGFIKPMDEFAVVIASEATVTVYTAKSQSMRAMGKADFQTSKDAVLQIVAEMIGVTADALAKNAMEAA